MRTFKEHFEQHWVCLIGASAITLGAHIFYDSDEGGVPQNIRIHEQMHVKQYARYGVVWFLMVYLFWYLKGRLTGYSHKEAYRLNPFEIEARQAERGT